MRSASGAPFAFVRPAASASDAALRRNGATLSVDGRDIASRVDLGARRHRLVLDGVKHTSPGSSTAARSMCAPQRPLRGALDRPVRMEDEEQAAPTRGGAIAGTVVACGSGRCAVEKAPPS